MSSNRSTRRTHHILILQKLLSLRDNASPFTLLLDSTEQSARPLISEFLTRAKINGTQTIFVSFQTLRKHPLADVYLKARVTDLQGLQNEIARITSRQRTLLVIDSLVPIATVCPAEIASFLSSFITSTTSVVATYHIDVPIIHSSSPYSPHPLTLLRFLATSIISTFSFSCSLARKTAKDRSLPEPHFGLSEDIEGVLASLGSNAKNGLVFEMEYRRRSGRGVREWFFLPTTPSSFKPSRVKEKIILLEDHPLYRVKDENSPNDGRSNDFDTTFNLGLTDKQRKDREGVVLPYFDAQRTDGEVGEGGRILYDMGSEDDFDEEEDEI